MYKTCRKCAKLTRHTQEIDKQTYKKLYSCEECSNTTSQFSKKEKARLEEKRKEIYQERTFGEVLNSISREINKND